MDSSRTENTHIISAMLNTNEVYSYSCTASDVKLYTTGAFTSSTSWNTRPTLSSLSDTETVAYGYNSSCPAHTVGFDSTAAVQRAANAGSASISFALVAGSETDIHGWKKFASGVDLIIHYQSYPLVPYDRAITCWSVCGLGAITASGTPIVSAQSRIADAGVNLNYTFQVCSGTVSSQGGCQSPVYLSNEPSGVTVSRALPSIGSGPYVWRVLACRADNTTMCSDWSGWFNFTVDLQGPLNPPAVTSSALQFNTGTDGTATVGSPATFTMGPNGATDLWGYAYSSSGSTTLSKALCPQSVGDVRVVCAAGTPTGSVIPEHSTGTVTVWSIDRAGNSSPIFNGSYQLPATAAAAVNHAWIGAQSDYLSPTSVIQDKNTVTPLKLHLLNTTWMLSGQDDTGTASDPTVDPTIPLGHDIALSFHDSISEAGSDALTSNPPITIDATHDATVAVWVKPSGTGSGPRVIMSQDSTGGYSAFTLLETSDGFFEMCLPTSTSAASVSDCATTQTQVSPTTQACVANDMPYTPSTDEAWLLVAGQWNSALKQITVSTLAYGSDGFQSLESAPIHTSCPASHATVAAASAGALVLGRDQLANAHGHWWSGEIADPIIYDDYQDFTTDVQGSLYGGLPTWGNSF